MPHGASYIAEEYTIKYCNQNYIGLENAGQVKKGDSVNSIKLAN